MSEITSINEKDVSLFRLKTELVELMQLRETEELTAEERAVIDGQIKAYVAAEIRKVDNVRSYLRHCSMMQEEAAKEAGRLMALAAMWEKRQAHLKELCRGLMTEFGEKRLEGLHGSLLLKGNGGLQALEIPQPELLPEYLVLYRGWMSAGTMAAIPEEVRGRQDFQFEREPGNGAIREALRRGEQVPGARLQERGTHVEVK